MLKHQTSNNQKNVYLFGPNISEGNANMRNLLGGKGANLAEMSKLGLPVPYGFTISTEMCMSYYDNHCQLSDNLKNDITQAIRQIEKIVGQNFGDGDNPLLFSVRSGARVSMPGMMDTVLNLGLNDNTVKTLAKATNNSKFAYDSYRRFLQIFGDVVLHIDHDDFEHILELHKEQHHIIEDSDLTADILQEIVVDYKALIKEKTSHDFVQSPWEQLWLAIEAVFNSWTIQRAKTYRVLHNIPESWGTAVNVQMMVFGNMGDDCATGVAFTRDPSTGENAFYGEFLVNAQGEDVVAGIRTPQPLTIIAAEKQKNTKKPSVKKSMQEAMPDVFEQLNNVRKILEQHYRDMQDIEFTVQQGTLYMLQTRNGKRTSQASLKIACDMVDEGLIDKKEAITRIDANHLDQLLHPCLDPSNKNDIFVKGLPASPGAACGKICFTADEAEDMAKAGHHVILVRHETSPEDIHGMHAAKAILTARGGMTSHAAVVARGMGRPCVCGASDISIDQTAKTITVNGITLHAGDIITIDGANGTVYIGKIAMIQPDLSGDFMRLMSWADDIRKTKIRTNAETPEDCATARKFGAEGIGLCRTEHMFFDSDRITPMRAMILSENEDQRRDALQKLLPMQQKDFEEIFAIMHGLPVTIRLLDPPLHEFLPRGDQEISDIAKSLNIHKDFIIQRIAQLHENNPMLGHRGCRLLNSYPEICEMQVEAIIAAAIHVKKSTGHAPLCEIMVPLVAMQSELKRLRHIITKKAEDIMHRDNCIIDYQIGTMIELPRAALQAEAIAQDAEFFSFGTNDLTQTTFGFSRDDTVEFLKNYQQLGILETDPFTSLDRDGVGEIMKIAIERGHKSRPDIKLGICGEHGGDPASIDFCVENNLDYVSCSPYRVPIARLAAAQAVIKYY